MDARIRPATTADLFWLRMLLGQLFDELPSAYPSPGTKDLETQTAILASRLGGEDPSMICFIAEHEEVIVGFVLGDLLQRVGRPRNYLFASFFYVVPGWRKKGIGIALCQSLFRAAEGKAEVVEFVAQAGDKQWRQRGWATVGIVHALPVDEAMTSLVGTHGPANGAHKEDDETASG